MSELCQSQNQESATIHEKLYVLALFGQISMSYILLLVIVSYGYYKNIIEVRPEFLHLWTKCQKLTNMVLDLVVDETHLHAK